MNFKYVLLSTRYDYLKNINEFRQSLDINLIKFINSLNYQVVIIPYNENKKEFHQYLGQLSKRINVCGIILSGGNDLGTMKIRDRCEREMIDFSIEKNIPLVGICRGMQIINKYFGGKIDKINNHVKKTHKIFDVNKNFISRVNSYHSFCIKIKNNNLKPIYFSEDESIEMIAHKIYKIIGIMWHPERYKTFKKFDLQIFKKFLS